MPSDKLSYKPLSDEDIIRFSPLRYQQHCSIAKTADVSLSLVVAVLKGRQRIKSDRSVAIIKEAERQLKQLR